jgi:WD40 repeat protein/tRNA A-37 threonylcarbamoyl transferase component Bud32
MPTPDDATETMPDPTGAGEPEAGRPVEGSPPVRGPDGPLAGTLGVTSGGEDRTVTAGPGSTAGADRPVDVAPTSADDRGREPTDVAPGFGTAAGQARFLGDYEILDEMARGGMGVVYRARQAHLGRTVALKLVRDPSLATYAEIRRFRQEAEAVAELDHPNIVPIYEVGQTEDQPYFSMKLVEGGNLTRHVGRLKESPCDAAGLMIKVARAVHYAHQRAILHRDLKPSNILVGENDEPYVTDFGLAKRIDPGNATAQTVTGAVMGTPAYMPPEQAGGGTKSLTTAADVYSLGATLYETLTGQAPFAGDSVAEILRRVIDQEPARPRSLSPKLDPDLETICLKCLEKDPSRRYGTADALADDLERWLEGRPIKARPVKARERVVKWMRRKPALAGLIGVSAVALLSLVVVWAYLTRNLQRALDVAERGRYAAGMKLGEQAFENSRFSRVEALVQAHDPARPGGRDDRHGFEWYYLRAVSDPEHMSFRADKGSILYLTLSPDGALLATCGRDRAVRLWDARTGRATRVLEGHGDTVRTVAFDRAGARLASGGSDRTVRVWDVATGRPDRTIGPLPDAVIGVALSPDGQTLAINVMDESVHVYDFQSRESRVFTVLPPGDTHSVFMPYPMFTGDGFPIFFTPPSGDRLVVVAGARSGGLRVVILDAATGRLLHTFPGLILSGQPLIPDGRLLAVGGQEGVHLHDTRTGVREHLFTGFGSRVEHVAIDASGELLVVTAHKLDDGIKLWDLPGRRELRTLPLAGSTVHPIEALSLSPDGRTLAVATAEGTVHLWYNLLGRKESVLRVGPSEPRLSRLSLDAAGRLLAVGSQDGSVVLADVPSRSVLRRLTGPEGPVYRVACRGDGRVVAAAGADGHVWVWDAADGHLVRTLGNGHGQVLAVAFDRAGRRLAAVGDDRSLRTWDATTWAQVLTVPEAHEGMIHGVAFSPDGQTLATAGGDQTVKLWDARSGRLRRTLRQGSDTAAAGAFFSAAFSPDGRQVVAASAGGVAVVWDAGWGTVRATLTGHTGKVYHAAFSPDGRRVVTAGADGTVRLWDPVLGAETFEFRHTAPLAAAALTPDGFQLVAAGWDGSLLFWDATPIVHEPGRGAIRAAR